MCVRMCVCVSLYGHVTSVRKVVSRPKFAEQISVEVGEQNVIFTGIIFFQNMESKTE